MKKPMVLAALLAIFTISALSVAGGSIPSSNRSRQAVFRVKPQLERDFARKKLKFGAPIYLRIFKEEKELEIWVKQASRFTLFRKFPICTYGFGSLGPKTRKGDGQAPEGFYYVKPDQLNPVSTFHLSFNLGYPNRYDRIHQRTGGALMVHGDCVSIGCYAMTDKKIEEIYAIADAALRNGQPFFRVHIFPFRMTGKNMQKHMNSRWYPFWQNLRQGYDFFEKKGNTPPNVEVKNKRYVFNPSG
ncbi:MAG: murein L,D-transpeptidase family protein [Thermodesulfobacteriota bacterium]|nr:murein L,D-transpeptidase family protein [Thermodesulfobacteriota bacterium]